MEIGLRFHSLNRFDAPMHALQPQTCPGRRHGRDWFLLPPIKPGLLPKPRRAGDRVCTRELHDCVDPEHELFENAVHDLCNHADEEPGC